MTRSAAQHADWTFRPVKQADAPRTTVRVQGRLVTDSGEQAHDWALAGLGLVRRSFWDVEPDLAAGRLVEVLGKWTSDSAPIQAVFPSRRFLPARTRLLIDRLVTQFAQSSISNRDASGMQSERTLQASEADKSLANSGLGPSTTTRQ